MYIAVSGNIGAGKTTLVEKLANQLGWIAEYEAVDQNPYLIDFYQDMRRWAFPLQICFLSHRFRQGLSLTSSAQKMVMDRTIYEDAEIFARNLFQSGYLEERDYQNYLFLYSTMVELVAKPVLLIYLKGNTSTLMQRVQQRNFKKKIKKKNNEELIPFDYLNNLNILYDEWIRNFKLCPVITVDIVRTDLKDEENFYELVEQINLLIN